MSRSRRKTPKCGWTVSSTNKWYKQKAHRKERKLVKNQLDIVSMSEIPTKLESYNRLQYGDPWNSPKDGKQYFGDIVYRKTHQWYIPGMTSDPNEIQAEYIQCYKKLMRK